MDAAEIVKGLMAYLKRDIGMIALSGIERSLCHSLDEENSPCLTRLRFIQSTKLRSHSKTAFITITAPVRQVATFRGMNARKAMVVIGFVKTVTN